MLPKQWPPQSQLYYSLSSELRLPLNLLNFETNFWTVTPALLSIVLLTGAVLFCGLETPL